MISPYAIRRFLKRKLKDGSKAKRFVDTALDGKLDKLDVPPTFVTTPERHQKAMFLLGTKYSGYLYFADMGVGKTKVILDLIKWRIDRGDIRRALVLVPFASNVGEWEDEAQKHQPGLVCVGLDGTAGERRALVGGSAEICVTTYAGFLRMVSTMKRSRAKGKKYNMVLDLNKIDKMSHAFDFICADECSFLRNKDSKTWKALSHMRRVVEYFYGLTGTPFNRTPIGLWSQFFLADWGETLGETIGMFREAFFTTEKSWFGKRGGKKKFGKKEYRFNKGMEADLRRMISNRSISYDYDEALPAIPVIGGLSGPRGYMLRRVGMSKSGWDMYQDLLQKMKDAEGDFTMVDNLYVQLRQLTSGYLTVQDENIDKTVLKFPDNPKMDALVDLINQIPDDCKVIVGHWLRSTGDVITEGLAARGIKSVSIRGGMGKAKLRSAKQRFTKGKVRVLVANEAAAFGLNLQRANYMILYETPSSPIIRRQLERRIVRKGQGRRCVIWDIIVRGSIDVRILKGLVEGYDLHTAIVSGKGKGKGKKRVKP